MTLTTANSMKRHFHNAGYRSMTRKEECAQTSAIVQPENGKGNVSMNHECHDATKEGKTVSNDENRKRKPDTYPSPRR